MKSPPIITRLPASVKVMSTVMGFKKPELKLSPKSEMTFIRIPSKVSLANANVPNNKEGTNKIQPMALKRCGNNKVVFIRLIFKVESNVYYILHIDKKNIFFICFYLLFVCCKFWELLFFATVFVAKFGRCYFLQQVLLQNLGAAIFCNSVEGSGFENF